MFETILFLLLMHFSLCFRTPEVSSSLARSPHHIVNILPNDVFAKNSHNISVRRRISRPLQRQETEMFLPSISSTGHNKLSSKILPSPSEPLKKLCEEPSIRVDENILFESCFSNRKIASEKVFTAVPCTSSLNNYGKFN